MAKSIKSSKKRVGRKPGQKARAPKRQTRPNWDEYFMHLSREVATRATCDRGRAGCVIVKDKRLMTTGYVGSPVGLVHCDDEGHDMRKMVREDGTISKHCVRTIHAEQNAICQAARFGIRLEGATLYCKFEPCYTCAKMIINVGIKRVVCEKRYHAGVDTRRIFKEAGILFEVLTTETENYQNQ